MRSLLPLFAVLLLAVPAFADATSLGEVRLPELSAVPVPTPGPVAVTKLTASQLYVIDSNTELSVVASRDGLVTITAETGPLKIRGLFVDDPKNKPTTKTFKGPFLYVVEAVQSGTVELILFKDLKTAPIRRTIDVEAGQAPQPPPGPKPVPPTPTPADLPPIAGPGVKVMIVIPKEGLPKAQEGIVFGKASRDALEAKCAVGPDGKNREYRIWFPVEDASGESKQWQDAFAKAKSNAVPWLILSDGKGKVNSYEGPLPVDAAEFLKLLDKAAK